MHPVFDRQVRDRNRPNHGYMHPLPGRHLPRDDRGDGRGGLQGLPDRDLLWSQLECLHGLRRQHVLADRGRGRVLRG